MSGFLHYVHILHHDECLQSFGTGVELFLARNFDHSYDHFVGALRDPDNIVDVAEVAVYFPNKATAMSLLERARKMGTWCYDDINILNWTTPQAAYICAGDWAPTVSRRVPSITGY